MRTYISWSSRRLHRARLQLPRQRLRIARRLRLPVPACVDADRGPIHRPQHRRPLRVARRLHLDGPEAAGQRIFDHLLDQGAKAVHRVRLLQHPAQARAASCVRQRPRRRPHAAPHPHLPVHRRDAVLDHVDRPPHHRRLRKPAQVHRRRLGQQCRPGNCTGLRIEGSASVLRSASASTPRRQRPLSWPLPVACRHISRNCSATLTRTFLLPAKNKRHSPKGPCLFASVVSDSALFSCQLIRDQRYTASLLPQQNRSYRKAAINDLQMLRNNSITVSHHDFGPSGTLSHN